MNILEIIHNIDEGILKVPSYQRRYVLDKSKIEGIMTSTFYEYMFPIPLCTSTDDFYARNFLKEIVKEEYESQCLDYADFDKSDDSVKLVMDGSQRCQNWYNIYNGYKIDGHLMYVNIEAFRQNEKSIVFKMLKETDEFVTGKSGQRYVRFDLFLDETRIDEINEFTEIPSTVKRFMTRFSVMNLKERTDDAGALSLYEQRDNFGSLNKSTNISDEDYVMIAMDTKISGFGKKFIDLKNELGVFSLGEYLTIYFLLNESKYVSMKDQYTKHYDEVRSMTSDAKFNIFKNFVVKLIDFFGKLYPEPSMAKSVVTNAYILIYYLYLNQQIFDVQNPRNCKDIMNFTLNLICASNIPTHSKKINEMIDFINQDASRFPLEEIKRWWDVNSIDKLYIEDLEHKDNQWKIKKPILALIYDTQGNFQVEHKYPKSVHQTSGNLDPKLRNHVWNLCPLTGTMNQAKGNILPRNWYDRYQTQEEKQDFLAHYRFHEDLLDHPLDQYESSKAILLEELKEVLKRYDYEVIA
jgi:hypothetical protein